MIFVATVTQSDSFKYTAINLDCSIIYLSNDIKYLPLLLRFRPKLVLRKFLLENGFYNLDEYFDAHVTA
jgi:hypothetical protein